MKQQPPKPWTRLSQSQIASIMVPFAEKVDEAWIWNKDSYTLPIFVHYLEKQCKLGKITHITIKKVDMKKIFQDKMSYFYSDEPNYEEKVKILSHISDISSTIAFEVFPSQNNVVDQANLYHIWVAEKAKFPFPVNEVSEIPKDQEWIRERFGNLEIEYLIKVIRTKVGKAACIYLKRCDGKELHWAEKQLLKNEIQFDDIVAVELISKHGIGKVTCLLALPLDYELDFGLHVN